MRILFAFNGSLPELQEHPVVHDEISSNGTPRTTALNDDVQPLNLLKASNDALFLFEGRSGQVGHLNIDIGNDHPISSAGLENAEERAAIMQFDGELSREIADSSAGLSRCEDCAHFDFLYTSVSQSCLIYAARPYKRDQAGRFTEILALCSQKIMLSTKSSATQDGLLAD